MPYPTAFPADQALALAAYLRGASTESLPVLVEDAYDLAGYGLRLMVGGKPTPGLMLGVPPSDENAAAELLQMSESHGQLVGSLPGWLVPFAISLIQRLLEEWQKA